MNKTLLILLLSGLAFGCSHKKVIEAKYENGNPRIEKYYHKNAGKPELVREVVYYENGQVKLDGAYKDVMGKFKTTKAGLRKPKG